MLKMKRVFAALLCALVLLFLMTGAGWPDPGEGGGGEGGGEGSETVTDPPEEPSPSAPPEEHDHSDYMYYVPANEPTCLAGGSSAYYVCSYCGQWFLDAGGTQPITDRTSVVLPRGDHRAEIFMGRAATCTEDGLTAGFVCAFCGEPVDGYVAPQTIPAKGHSPAENWSSDAGGHWHVCTECGERLDFAAHVSGGPATATAPEVCTECGFVIRAATGSTGTVRPTPRPTPTPTPTPSPTPTPEVQPGELLSSRVRFVDAGEAQMDDLVLEQPDAGTAQCVADLPWQRPVSAGWYFEGWRCDIDGALYQPGDTLSFSFAGHPEVQLTAEWTVLIGRGNYDLTAGMRYRLAEGTYSIDGDTTVYYGGSAFYVREGGNYTIR